MTRNRVISSLLLATGMFLMAGCATQSASRGSLDDRYFQREANKLQKFEHEGKTIFCQNDSRVGSLIPHRKCITESGLRQLVENARRSRNSVAYTQVRSRG